MRGHATATSLPENHYLRFVLDTALLYVEVDKDGVRGKYQAQNGGSLLPKIIPLQFHAGQRVRFAA